MNIFSTGKKLTGLFASVFFFTSITGSAQNTQSEIHGSFQFDGAYYLVDSTIGANAVAEKFLSNAYGDLVFTHGNFKAGLRYEAYQNALLGYDTRYKGNGIANRYAQYTVNELEVTLGNFYEQFGSGLILRAYWEPTLGLDNSLDGIRVKYNPIKGIYIKGLVGRQRSFFEYGPGTVRGLDGEIAVNELFSKLTESKTHINQIGRASCRERV